MDTSGQALINFWDEVAERRTMNPKTAGSYRSACEAVLSAADGRHRDMHELADDGAMSEVIAQFKLRRPELSELTVQTYESQFRKAVPSFLSYAGDREHWEPPVRSRQSTLLALRAESAAARNTSSESLAPLAQSAETTIHIGLTDGRMVRVILPASFGQSDAQLLLDVMPAYLKRFI